MPAPSSQPLHGHNHGHADQDVAPEVAFRYYSDSFQNVPHNVAGYHAADSDDLKGWPALAVRGPAYGLPDAVAEAESQQKTKEPQYAQPIWQYEEPDDAECPSCSQSGTSASQQVEEGDVIGRKTYYPDALPAARSHRCLDKTTRANRLTAAPASELGLYVRVCRTAR